MYRENTYLSEVHKALSGLKVGESAWFDIECPRWGGRKAIKQQRSAISKVSKEMGITVATTLPADCLLIKRIA